MVSDADKRLLSDVMSIAQFKLWGSDEGDRLAQELIDQIHDGKYGSSEGVWVQAYKALDRLWHVPLAPILQANGPTG